MKTKWQLLASWVENTYKYRLLFLDDMTASFQYVIQYCQKGKLGEDEWVDEDSFKYNSSAAQCFRHLIGARAVAVA